MTVSERYSRASIALHWLTVAVFIGVYACIELREIYPRGSDPREALKTWHFMLGLTVFVLVWVRFAARIFGRAPPIVPPVPRWQAVAAMIVEAALYVLMIILPILGWLTLSAEGTRIPFYGLQLPPLVSPNEQLAASTERLHETLATARYFIIALHVSAALFHHYVRRDNTLRRMLPGRS